MAKQGTDPVDALDKFDSAMVVDETNDAAKIRDQVSGEGWSGAGFGATASGGGTLFTEPVLVVNQKAKIIELTNQYGVFDQNGNQIGAVNQVGQSTLKKALRLLTSVDQFLTHKIEITDRTGAVVLRVTRPAKILKSTVVVEDANGTELGRVVQKNMIGKINFKLESGGQQLGEVKAENWRAWNFRIEDATGTEVARITPKPGKVSPRRCSPPPITTSCRSTGVSPNRCGRWWLLRPFRSIRRSNRMIEASARKTRVPQPATGIGR